MNLSEEAYTALVSLARRGVTTPEEQRVFEEYLRLIDLHNGIKRYVLLVKFQEQNAPIPPTAKFPERWPPELSFTIEQIGRPISKTDVLAHLDAKANEPTNVMVTKDTGGVVGWTKLEDFFL